MYLAKNMKKFREEKRWTQAELAKKAGCNISHIARLESGKYIPSLSLAMKLAEIFEVDLNTLVSNSNPDLSDIKIEDGSFYEKIKLLKTLEEEERKTITNVIDAFLTKKQIQKLVKAK